VARKSTASWNLTPPRGGRTEASHCTSPLPLSQIPPALQYTPRPSSIRIAIQTLHLRLVCVFNPWVLDFPRRLHTHVPDFRVSPLSIAAADGGALPILAPPEHTWFWRGAASSMFTTTMNTTLILPTCVGATSVGKHHRRLGFMVKTKRRLSDMREASVRPMYVSVVYVSVSFLVLPCFLSHFLLFFERRCMFLGFPFLFLVFVLFGLRCPCFILAFLTYSCIAIQECLALCSCSPCFYLLAIVSTFPPNNIWFSTLVDFRSFILCDSFLLPNPFMTCLLQINFTVPLIVY